jgi:hypothetical protein
VTMAVMWGVWTLRPRKRADSPVPPPMATTLGAWLTPLSLLLVRIS